MPNHSEKIGFIGQGWIGKHLADHFEKRGFPVIRYAKDGVNDNNLEQLKDAEIVFVAVPTPTTPEGFDDSILRSVLSHANPGQSVIIKSTILPGKTDELSEIFPDIFLFHSPEFLRETSVEYDIANPDRNIVGVPGKYINDPTWKQKAERILSILQPAPYAIICSAAEAELTKYGGNNFLYTKVVFMNMLHDLATHHQADWRVIARNMTADPRIGTSHMQPIHQIEHLGKEPGRGAGGHCFIKDFAALRKHIEEVLPDDQATIALLRAFEEKNNQLLRGSKKDLDLLRGVYGE